MNYRVENRETKRRYSNIIIYNMKGKNEMTTKEDKSCRFYYLGPSDSDIVDSVIKMYGDCYKIIINSKSAGMGLLNIMEIKVLDK